MAIQLNKREQYGVGAAGIVIVIFLILNIMVFPLVDKKERLTRSLSAQKSALEEMTKLRQQYKAITQNTRLTKSRIGKRERNFTLFSFLDTLAGRSGIKTNIVYMKPSTSTPKNSPYRMSLVELKLQSITLEQLVSYLHGVESSGKMLTVKRISISKSDKTKELINSILLVETVML